MRDELRRKFINYRSKIKSAKTHPAKEIIFFNFLKDIFGIDVEEFALKTEKPLKSKAYKVRGRADLIYRGVILEVKVNLKKELEQGIKELKKYMLLLAEEGETDYVGIITDGIDFRAYIMPKNEIQRAKELLDKEQKFDDVLDQISLKEISSFRVEDSAEEFILWLDSYFFTQRNIKPTAEDLQIKFGLESPTFTMFFERFKELFNEVRNIPSVNLKFTLWRKHLEIVYGSAPDEDEFIIHTYLVTLVKLIMYLRLYGAESDANIEKIIDGTYFRELGILNFIEEDFFTWILEEPIRNESLKLIRNLFNELDIYDFDQADEDLFKEIYQDIVGPSTRHRLGEYYTPEWLAELTLLEALNHSSKEIPRILDPACGSGTFITNAINLLKKKLLMEPPNKQLEIILANVVGIDVNPLAVIIARANYIIALGELIKYKKEEILIPIYLADSIKLPEIEEPKLISGKRTYKIQIKLREKPEIGGIKPLLIPVDIVKNEKILSKVLERIKILLMLYRDKEKSLQKENLFSVFRKYLIEVLQLDEETASILLSTFNTLLFLLEHDLDSIWIFVLRNIYAPIRMKEEKFDIIVGNPPWIKYSFLNKSEYQEFCKKLAIEYELISKNQNNTKKGKKQIRSIEKQIANIEIATIFFRRVADLYLKDGGIIAFVMPRTILTGAKHHEKFREFKKPIVKVLKVLDLHYNTQFRVEPLFNFPSCVIIAKKGEKTSWPIEVLALSAKLSKRNLKLREVLHKFKKLPYKYNPPKIPISEKSYYHDKFKRGADIYPRPLWFITFVVDETFGINPKKPKVKTSEEALKKAKKRWKNVKIEGCVESEFIFITLLSDYMKPFGFSKLTPIVLPIIPMKNGYTILNISRLSLDYPGMAKWLVSAEKFWKAFRTKKDEKRFPSVLDRLNYHRYLTSQDRLKRYIVLYAMSGKYTMACVLDREEIKQVKITINDIEIIPKDFVIDTSTYYYCTDDANETHYLCSIINSNIIDKMIKKLQPTGLYGERTIHRKIFELPIPKFNPNDPRHIRLAELSKECHRKIKNISIKDRRKVKEYLSHYIKEIDALVEEILSEHL